jgi:hypothetical protein
MSEKIISEIRFVETEDGFRIEVKGDMGRLKNMDWGPGPCGPDFPPFMGFGHGRGFWKWGRRSRHGHGRFHGHSHHAGPPPGARPWWCWDADEPDEDADYDMPPGNV